MCESTVLSCLSKPTLLLSWLSHLFTANTYIIDRNCFIAKQVRYKMLEELTEIQAMTTIAKHCGVSWSTVSRTLASLIPMTKVKRNWLPRCLLMDEFRSLKNQVGPYSFSCLDGDTRRIKPSFLILCNLSNVHD